MIKEVIISLVVLAGSIGLYWSLSFLDDPRAGAFPRVVLIIMGVLSLVLLVQSLLMKRGLSNVGMQQACVGAKSGKTFLDLGTVATCFFLIIAYFAVMEWLGFYFSAFLFFTASTFILGRKDLTARTAAFRALVSLIFVAILYVLFSILLAVQTPKGLFI